MLQANVGGESQKSGITRAEVDSIARRVLALTSLRVIGLMAIRLLALPMTRVHTSASCGRCATR